MKNIILAILFSFLFVSTVNAKEKVDVYMFWGDGCSHCEKEKAFFEELDEEYFELHMFEVFNDASNKELLDLVGEQLSVNITGVPFTVIGYQTFTGYSSDIGTKIKNTIISEYESGISEDKVGEIIENRNYIIENEVIEEPTEDIIENEVIEEPTEDIIEKNTKEDNNNLVYYSLGLFILLLIASVIFRKKI